MACIAHLAIDSHESRLCGLNALYVTVCKDNRCVQARPTSISRIYAPCRKRAPVSKWPFGRRDDAGCDWGRSGFDQHAFHPVLNPPL